MSHSPSEKQRGPASASLTKHRSLGNEVQQGHAAMWEGLPTPRNWPDATSPKYVQGTSSPEPP